MNSGTRVQCCRLKPRCVKAFKDDWPYLVQTEPKYTLREISAGLCSIQDDKIGLWSIHSVLEFVKKLQIGLGEDGLLSMYRLIRDHLAHIREGRVAALSKSLQLRSSAYTAVYLALPRDVRLLESKAISSRATRRLSQWIVTTDSFYGSERDRYDNFMVLAEDEGEE